MGALMRYAIVPCLMALYLTGCASASSTPRSNSEWEPRKGVGFHNTRTGESKSEEQFLEYAQGLDKAGQVARADDAYQMINDYAIIPEVRRKALMSRAEMHFRLGRFEDAYHLYDKYARDFPTDPSAVQAKRYGMESARQLAEIGVTRGWLVFKSTSPERGIELLRKALDRYTHEEFSPWYAFWLGEFLFNLKRIDEALLEFDSVQKLYRDTDYAAQALFMMGQCELSRFKGVPFDTQPLKDALKYFERVAQEFPKSQAAVKAREMLVQVQEIMAEKEWNTAMFYKDRDKPKAVAVYLESIVTRYPKTKHAARALDELRSMGVDVKKLEERVRDAPSNHK